MGYLVCIIYMCLLGFSPSVLVSNQKVLAQGDMLREYFIYFSKSNQSLCRGYYIFAGVLNGRHCGPRLLCIHVQLIMKSLEPDISVLYPSKRAGVFFVLRKVPTEVYVPYKKVIQAEDENSFRAECCGGGFELVFRCSKNQ